MAQLAQAATTLINEMLAQDGALPPYNEEVINAALSQIEDHKNQMDAIMTSARGDAETEAGGGGVEWNRVPNKVAAVIIHHESILKLKRIILTYLKVRHDCLMGLRWEQRALPEAVRDNLSPAEVEFYRAYDAALNQYMGPDGIKMDLTTDTRPPKNVAIRVQVLRDAGALALSHSAKVPMSAGSVHTMQCNEAEQLIRSGVLQVLDTNR